MEDQIRPEGHHKFSRFIDLASSLTYEGQYRQFDNPQVRVDFIKNTPINKFFDFLNIGNSLLRQGKIEHWQGKTQKTVVSMGEVVSIDPPDDPGGEFQIFYEKMQKDINPDNLNLWSAKLYTAIIFARLFPDGNGRLARNTYALLRDGKLLDETLSSNRSPEIAEYAILVNQEAVFNEAEEEGLAKKGNKDTNAYQDLEDTYAAGEEDQFSLEHIPSPTHVMKYIAAKRVLEQNGQDTPEQKIILLASWSPENKQKFNDTYQEIRREWFWKTIDTVNKYPTWCISKLDKAVGIA